MSSVSGFIKSFDLYRKMPSDLAQGTSSGTIVSIIASLVMLLLFISQIQGYIAVDQKSQMFVDSKRGEQKIRVNFELVFPKYPCDILALSAQDAMGSAITGLQGHVQKYRLDKDGNELQLFKLKHDEENGSRRYIQDILSRTNLEIEGLDYERVAKAVKDHQGCLVQGFVLVHRVPGFLLFSSKPFGHALYRVYSETRVTLFDLSH